MSKPKSRDDKSEFFVTGTKLSVMLIFVSIFFVPATKFGFFGMNFWVFLVGVIGALAFTSLAIRHYVSRRKALPAKDSES